MSAEHLAVLLALLSGLVGGASGSQPAAERLTRLGLGAVDAGDAGIRSRGPAGSLDHVGAGGKVGASRRGASRWSGRSAAAAAVLLGLSGHGGAAIVTGVLAVALLAPAASARRRLSAHHRALSRDVPRAADLLATCLEAGAAPAAALGVVANVINGPLSQVLGAAAATLASGGTCEARSSAASRVGEAGTGEPGHVGHVGDVGDVGDVRVFGDFWDFGDADSGSHPDRIGPTAALLAAFGRAASTGAPLASTLRDIASDERERARGLALERARKAGVYAIGPLAVCHLPAFVLVGVVPVVVGVARSLLTGWA